MDANALAHELHRRRLSLSANAPRHQAAGEARFCDQYGYMPSLDDFDHYMNLVIYPDPPNGEWQWGDEASALCVVTTASDTYHLTDKSALIPNANYVFTQGEKLAETKVVGWLPYERVISAPQVQVNINCLFPMPKELDPKNPVFEEPDLNVPMLWSYELQAFWTPLGFHVYDNTKKGLVLRTEEEIRK